MATGTIRRELSAGDFLIRTATVDNIELGAGALYNEDIDASYSGFTVMGVVGYRVDAASTNGTGNQYVNIYRCDKNVGSSSETIRVSARNTHSSTIRIQFLIRVLYMRTLS